MLKRIISAVLVLTLLFSLVPTVALAETGQSQATVEDSELTVEGSNSFGTLVSDAITENTEETEAAAEDYPAGYEITDLVIEGNVATVTYSSLEKAVLVVALYTEDGLQLIDSANTQVTAEANEATVTFSGAMPDYFLAEAFLLDTYDHSPLCVSMETPMYTSDMQELLVSTVADYDADRVFNLDEDEDTNFAVFNDGVIVIDAVEGVNTVVSVDDENYIYVFEAVDDKISSLQAGDVVSYPYGEGEMLIFKVASVTVEGTKATVTGAELEIEEVFDYMKLESMGDSSQITVDDSVSDEGISYLGVDGGVSTFAYDGDVTASLEHKFELYKKEIKDTTSDESLALSVTLEGSLQFSIDVKVEYYISLRRQYIKFEANAGATLSVDVTGELTIEAWKLGRFEFMPVSGIFVRFEPRLKLEFSGSLSLKGKFSFGTGLHLEHRAGGNFTAKKLGHSPKWEADFEFEGKVFFGVDLHPTVSVMSSAIAKGEVSGLIGVEISGKLEKKFGEEEDNTVKFKHACQMCLDGDIAVVTKVSISFKFLNSKKMSLTCDLLNKSYKLADFYYSYDYDEMDWGECPHNVFKVTIVTKDREENNISDIQVKLSDGKELGTSNKNGLLDTVYLKEGHYTFCAQIDGQPVSFAKYIDGYTTVILTSNEEYYARLAAAEKLRIEPDTTEGASRYKSGVCGSDVEWTLYTSGLLKIYGSGNMDSFSGASAAPWYPYRDKIKSVHVMEGINNVSRYAFDGYSGIEKVVLDDSVATIASYAFRNCSGLKQLRLGVDTDTTSFVGCTKVESIHYTYGQTGKMDYRDESPSTDYYGYCYTETLEYFSRSTLRSVYFEEGVTRVGSHAFRGVTALTDVVLPTTLEVISINAFYGCSSLVSIHVPDRVYYLGDRAFYDCKSLEKITFPSQISSIKTYTFAYCTDLEELVIPNNVRDIVSNAFTGCSGLKSVTMPVDIAIDSNISSPYSGTTNVENIRYTYGRSGVMSTRSNSSGDSEYYQKTLEYYSRAKLKTVTFEAGISSISSYAFSYATALSSVTFEGNAPSFGGKAFYGTTTTIYYPADNATWTDDVFQNYGGTLTWVPYEPEETVELGTIKDTAGQQSVTLSAAYGGENQTEFTEEDVAVQVTTFSGLTPGAQYVMIAVVDLEAETLLEPDNLLFIDQAAAGEDGSLIFRYVQRAATDEFYVFVCGSSDMDLKDAEVFIPEYTANGEAQKVEPEVSYAGQMLTEGVDYVLVDGDVFTAGGAYTLTIRGINNYSGTVIVPYTVAAAFVQPTLTLSYPTLSFEDEIFYNVYFTVDDISSVVEMGLMLLPSLMAEATIDDAIGTVPGYLTNGSLFMARSEGIPAAHMGDTVYFKVYAKLTDGTYAYSGAGGYNAKAYANTVLGGSYPEAMKSLVVAMVEYGAEAQLFFGHNIDKLVNAALTDEQKALVSSYDESMVDAVVAADSSKTANFVRVNSNFSALYPSVSFDGAFSINYYCTPAIPVDAGMTLYWWDAETYDTISAFTVENATGSMEMTATNGQYWGCVPGIAAKDMDKTYYVSCVFESEGEPITSGIIAYSLGRYCEGKAAANGDVQQAFAQATAVYGYYAKRYFAGIA